MWYCLPDSLSPLVYNPETASRVTLAVLGIVFQTALTVLARHIQNQSRITQMRRICSFHGFLLSCWISLRLPGAEIFTDKLLLEVIQRRIGANTIRSKSNTK